MKLELCDICKQNESDIRYKIKRSNRGRIIDNGNTLRWVKSVWQPYEKIAICKKCAENVISIKKVNK